MGRQKYATLDAGMLARKGEARPATVFDPEIASPVPSSVTSAKSGPTATRPIPLAVVSAGVTDPFYADYGVVATKALRQHSKSDAPSALVERIDSFRQRFAGRPPARRVALTLRLEKDEYVRVKLASAQNRRSCQDLMRVALDQYLDALGTPQFIDDSNQKTGAH